MPCGQRANLILYRHAERDDKDDARNRIRKRKKVKGSLAEVVDLVAKDEF